MFLSFVLWLKTSTIVVLYKLELCQSDVSLNEFILVTGNLKNLSFFV